jgi:biopolymer transport protein ExbD
MKLGRARAMDEASFDLTPMVDVILLLIIFFTFTTQFAALTGAPVDLPIEKGESVKIASKKTLIVDLTESGQLIVLGRPIAAGEFVELAKREKMLAGESLELIIRADRRASASHLNAVAEALAAQGVRSWKLATAPGGG